MLKPVDYRMNGNKPTGRLKTKTPIGQGKPEAGNLPGIRFN